LELFRTWRESEDLDLEWLLKRLRGEEPQTEAMKAGEALHATLEHAAVDEYSNIEHNGWRFYFRCDCEVELPTICEIPIEKQYGDLLVRGRVDGMTGNKITDYKSTQSFDVDRLLEGYQWRFYLDMTGCEAFIWKVFVIGEMGLPQQYEVIQVHELRQYRYPGMEDDCARLAKDFYEFVRQIEASNIAWTKTAVLRA
jgi:hypothetical protein